MEFDLNYDNALMYHGMKCKIGVESDLTTNSYFELQLHSEIQKASWLYLPLNLFS